MFNMIPRMILILHKRLHCTQANKSSIAIHNVIIHAVKKIDELIKKDNGIKQSIIELKKKLL